MVIDLVFFIFIFVLIILLISKIWKTFKKFHHRNETYMDFVFILIYYLEQFLFLFLYYSDISHRELWVALIVLSVMTTASLDKLMMYSRHKYLKEIINSNLIEKEALFNNINNQNKELKDRDNQIKIMDGIISELE